MEKAFSHHLDQTRDHVTRLETIFSQLGVRRDGEECEGMKGLIKESEEIVNAMANNDVKDAALISAAQRVEHYDSSSDGVEMPARCNLCPPRIRRRPG